MAGAALIPLIAREAVGSETPAAGCMACAARLTEATSNVAQMIPTPCRIRPATGLLSAAIRRRSG